MSYFTTKELVPPETYLKLGDTALTLFDKKILITLEFIREQLGKPITVNNWHTGGHFKYRGFRPADCKVGALKSAHKTGEAVDFNVKNMTAEDVRVWLKKNADILPYPIRCESEVSWVHIDTRAKAGHKVYFFNP